MNGSRVASHPYDTQHPAPLLEDHRGTRTKEEEMITFRLVLLFSYSFASAKYRTSTSVILGATETAATLQSGSRSVFDDNIKKRTAHLFCSSSSLLPRSKQYASSSLLSTTPSSLFEFPVAGRLR